MFLFYFISLLIFLFIFNRNSIKCILKIHEEESKVLMTKFVDIKMLPPMLSQKEMDNRGGAN